MCTLCGGKTLLRMCWRQCSLHRPRNKNEVQHIWIVPSLEPHTAKVLLLLALVATPALSRQHNTRSPSDHPCSSSQKPIHVHVHAVLISVNLLQLLSENAVDPSTFQLRQKTLLPRTRQDSVTVISTFPTYSWRCTFSGRSRFEHCF